MRFKLQATVPHFCFLLATSLSIPTGAQAANSTMPLVSHKAIYELRLLEGVGTKAPLGANGQIAFDFSSSPCEGYAQTLRQVVEMQPQEGEPHLSETRSTTYEDAKGADFHFNVTTPSEKGATAVDGQAIRNNQGVVAIALNSPEAVKLKADSQVLFPTQHIERLLDAARAGEKVMQAQVYDGSDNGQKIFNVTAIIGQPVSGPDADKGAQAQQLQGLRRWPVALSYFPSNVRDGAPDYVLSFNLYENGVSSGLKLDYGDFILGGELMRIDFPAPAKCPR
jgi:hypothetical protein